MAGWSFSWELPSVFLINSSVFKFTNLSTSYVFENISLDFFNIKASISLYSFLAGSSIIYSKIPS